MKNKLRKKEHKTIVKWMRKWNKTLSDDDYVGINRFRIDMWSEKWYRFSDGSGGELTFVLKFTDNYTGNTVSIICNNFNYYYRAPMYLNDFMIRCSSGREGHFPLLNYVAYDIHTIKSYVGRDESIEIENGIIDKYNWLERRCLK